MLMISDFYFLMMTSHFLVNDSPTVQSVGYLVKCHFSAAQNVDSFIDFVFIEGPIFTQCWFCPICLQVLSLVYSLCSYPQVSGHPTCSKWTNRTLNHYKWWSHLLFQIMGSKFTSLMHSYTYLPNLAYLEATDAQVKNSFEFIAYVNKCCTKCFPERVRFPATQTLILQTQVLSNLHKHRSVMTTLV